MNVNFGLFPPLDEPAVGAAGAKLKGKQRGAAKKRLIADRALADLGTWLATQTF